MFACEIDNLRDHAVLFCDRMLEADTESTLKRVKLFYLKEYIHGFCSLASAGIDDYMKGTKLTCEMFKEMFDGNK